MSKLCNRHRDTLYLAEGKLAFGKNINRQEEEARGKKRTRGIRLGKEGQTYLVEPQAGRL